jgi:hypothetical protein
MHLQVVCAAIIACFIFLGCNNSDNDNQVSADSSAKRALNSEQQETPLPLAIKSPAPTIAVEEWVSDPALQAQLGDEKSDFCFGYRLPPSFTWGGMSGNNRTNFTLWHNELRDDNSVAHIMVLTGRIYPDIKEKPLEQAAADQLKTDQQRFSNVVPSKASLGTINGIPFYKSTFAMVDPKTSMPGRATVYHGHLGDHYFHLVYHDVEPHLAETEKLLEAAALSVRPKP